MTAKYQLPQLPYDYDALEPHITHQIMELHHSKHHATYVNNLNNVMGSLSKSIDIPTQLALQSALRFNGGGHINHSLFWENLIPAGSPDTKIDSAAPRLHAAILEQWGDFMSFQEAYEKMLLGLQGSGWGWLVRIEGSAGRLRLAIVTTKDQDPVVEESTVPLLGVDMWEHAYYLQYLNGKAAYVKAIWNVINWKTAEERYLGKREDAFKALRAAI